MVALWLSAGPAVGKIHEGWDERAPGVVWVMVGGRVLTTLEERRGREVGERVSGLFS